MAGSTCFMTTASCQSLITAIKTEIGVASRLSQCRRRSSKPSFPNNRDKDTICVRIFKHAIGRILTSAVQELVLKCFVVRGQLIRALNSELPKQCQETPH